jgi:hypothetical protein
MIRTPHQSKLGTGQARILKTMMFAPPSLKLRTGKNVAGNLPNGGLPRRITKRLFLGSTCVKPRRPALLARKPSRKIAFTFFNFARADFFF